MSILGIHHVALLTADLERALDYYTRILGLRLLARAAEVAKVDAGPAAVAFTPRGERATPAVAGLAEKNGRWLLAERIDGPRVRAERVAEVLGEVG